MSTPIWSLRITSQNRLFHFLILGKSAFSSQMFCFEFLIFILQRHPYLFMLCFGGASHCLLKNIQLGRSGNYHTNPDHKLGRHIQGCISTNFNVAPPSTTLSSHNLNDLTTVLVAGEFPVRSPNPRVLLSAFHIHHLSIAHLHCFLCLYGVSSTGMNDPQICVMNYLGCLNPRPGVSSVSFSAFRFPILFACGLFLAVSYPLIDMADAFVHYSSFNRLFSCVFMFVDLRLCAHSSNDISQMPNSILRI